MKPQPKLTVELVPSSSWLTNVRSLVSRSEWDKIRRKVYKRANHRCEICKGKGPKHPVEAHEIWEYDDSKHTQTLVGLIALCPPCHEVKHLGLAYIRNRGKLAELHLEKVNSWNRVQVKDYIAEQFEKHSQRSQYDWTVDISRLTQLLKF